MRLARVGEKGREQPALVERDGTVRSLAAHLDDITAADLTSDTLARLNAIDPATLPIVPAGTRHGIPFTGARKFVAVGLNYASHAAESGMPIPDEPVLFMKALSALAGPNDDVAMPRESGKMDWEVELGVVIGTPARYVARDDALAHVIGYVLVNDLSERAHQLEQGGGWVKGKSHDGFGPVGPWLVTTDELGDAGALDMFLDVSGERRQTGNTADMIFDVCSIVSYISQFMTLERGDIIATGTPPGVGFGMTPPRFLSVGDEVRLGISGLGEQRQRIVAPL